MHYFLLGPSGVGKTRFGNWLEANLRYHHIRVDNGDGSELSQEPRLWELWKRGNPKIIETAPSFIDVAGLFSDELQKCADANGKKGCVLTFWSYTVFPPNEIDSLAKHNIAVKYLYGPKENCIEAAISREAANGRADRDRAHWCTHNRTYQRMGGPGLSSYRADIITSSGERLSGEKISEILKIG
jgi:hypothetical protein